MNYYFQNINNINYICISGDKEAPYQKFYYRIEYDIEYCVMGYSSYSNDFINHEITLNSITNQLNKIERGISRSELRHMKYLMVNDIGILKKRGNCHIKLILKRHVLLMLI